MPTFIILAAMKGRFVSDRGNSYDNFQMMGYVESSTAAEAVSTFFDEPKYPIRWEDVEYLWAEQLADHPDGGHYGDYERVYVESLRRRNEPGSLP